MIAYRLVFFMRSFSLILILFIFSFVICGCTNSQQTTKSMSSYNSKKLDSMKQEYSNNAETSEQNEHKKYSIEDDVLKIDLK